MSLIAHFAAAHPNLRLGRMPEKVIATRGTSVPAIWRLYQNIQLIRMLLFHGDPGRTRYGEQWQARRTERLLWVDGGGEALPKDVQNCLKKLTDHSDDFVSALRQKKTKKWEDCFSTYVRTIVELLQEPGIVAWISARCGGELFRSTVVANRELGPTDITDHMMRMLKELFPDGSFSRRLHLVERFGFGAPLAIRTKPGSGFRPLHEVLADSAFGRMTTEERNRLDWLENVALPASIVRPLLDLCGDRIDTFLRLIGSRPVPLAPWYYYDPPLRIQDMRRILKVCRETQEMEVLQGAAAVLINAKFARIAEPEVIRKILTASPDSPLVGRMFNTRDAVRGDEQPLKDLARRVSSMILDDAERHPFRVVNRAAGFTAELEIRRIKPLFSEYPELQKPNHS